MAAATSRPWSIARSSVHSTVSHLWHSGRQAPRDGVFDRESSACDVPIYLSQSTEHVNHPHTARVSGQPQRSPRSTRSIVDTATHLIGRTRPLTLPASSVYSNSPAVRHHSHFEGIPERNHDDPVQGNGDLEDGNTEDLVRTTSITHDTDVASEKPLRPRPRPRRRVSSLRVKIESKRQLSLAFGVTMFAAMITYIVLATTKTANGLMFHILSIMVILILAGIFMHSVLRMIMLQKRRQVRRGRQHGHRRVQDTNETSTVSTEDSESHDHSTPNEPIQVTMASDDTSPRSGQCIGRSITIPPPVYGNFRGSLRMNPNLVYWQKTSPSPSTPTYEEAMRLAHVAVGVQPPLYISPRREGRTIEEPMRQRDSNVHPLERQRLHGLLSP